MQNTTSAGAGAGNTATAARAKTVLTDTTGAVEIDVPRDRERPRSSRRSSRSVNVGLSGVDEVVLSLYAKGLTTGEISAHLPQQSYGGIGVQGDDNISRITDKVIEEMNDWAVRPLDETYAAIFIDAIVVKVRDGQVANSAVLRGHWSHPGRGSMGVVGRTSRTRGEGAKF